MKPRRRNLSIVGNGMGTCRLLDELVRRNATSQYEITVYGEERSGAYNRILLGNLLAGEAPDSIVTKTPEWYDSHGIRLIQNTRVTRLDTRGKQIVTEQEQTRPYDIAVLATGSQPLVPPLEGLHGEDGQLRPGAFVYRTIADVIRIRDYARSGNGAVVVGGGLLGLEVAKGLSDRGLHVTIVQSSSILMNAQLDDTGGMMLARQIERCGIFTRLGRTVDAVYGEEYVRGVILDDGTSLPADLVVLACGVRPRVDLARDSGLPVNKGILVNDTLATELPGVYAFGECAEHRGRTYGIVGPVWEQATVLADVLTGQQPQDRYRGSKLYTRLKVAGVEVASMGVLHPELEGDQVLQVVEERRDAYRKLILRDGKLVGAMLVGATESAASLVQMFDRGDLAPEDPLELLCSSRPSAPSGDRQVCNCHKVTQQDIEQAIDGGCDTMPALCAQTRAGTGCGSCKGELVQLLAKHVKKPEAPIPLRALASA